jgi:hypothetical protein
MSEAAAGIEDPDALPDEADDTEAQPRPHRKRPIARALLIIPAIPFGLLTVTATVFLLNLIYVLSAPDGPVAQDFLQGFQQGAGETGTDLRPLIPLMAFATAVLALAAGFATGGVLWLRARLGKPKRKLAPSLRWISFGLSIAEGVAWVHAGLAALSLATYAVILVIGGEARTKVEDLYGMSLDMQLLIFGPTYIIFAAAFVYGFRALRSVILDIASGEEFQERNAARLMRAGIAMLFYQGIETAQFFLLKQQTTEALREATAALSSFHLWPGVLGLVLLAFGFAFREGARLKEEQDLTV